MTALEPNLAPPAAATAHGRPPQGPGAMFRALARHGSLIRQMTRREVVGRYRGSMLGLVWSFFHPLLMLAVYTFAFGYVLSVSPAKRAVASATQAATAPATGQSLPYALFVFMGLIIANLFAENVNRAPSLILQHANYVKKVIFPLEILPPVTLLASLVHAAMSICVLILFQLVLVHTIPWTAIFLPLVFLPLIFMTLGVSWFLASLGVYLRDVAHTIGVLTMVLMWLSTAFFPLEAIPNETVRTLIKLNPLTFPMERARGVLFYGELPQWHSYLIYTAASLLVAWLGFAWFQRTRRGFADVI